MGFTLEDTAAWHRSLFFVAGFLRERGPGWFIVGFEPGENLAKGLERTAGLLLLRKSPRQNTACHLMSARRHRVPWGRSLRERPKGQPAGIDER